MPERPLLGLLLLGATLSGADWYVAPGGNDGNAGTSSGSPLATIAAADGCDAEPSTTTVGQDPVLTIETWDACEGEAAVELVVVGGAGHAWMGSGGSGRRGDAVDVGYDATREIWAFLSDRIAS